MLINSRFGDSAQARFVTQPTGACGGNGFRLWEIANYDAGHDAGADDQQEQKRKNNTHTEKRDVQSLL